MCVCVCAGRGSDAGRALMNATSRGSKVESVCQQRERGCQGQQSTNVASLTVEGKGKGKGKSKGKVERCTKLVVARAATGMDWKMSSRVARSAALNTVVDRGGMQSKGCNSGSGRRTKVYHEPGGQASPPWAVLSGNPLALALALPLNSRMALQSQ